MLPFSSAKYQYGVPQGTIHGPVLFQNQFKVTLRTNNPNIAIKYLRHCTWGTQNDKDVKEWFFVNKEIEYCLQNIKNGLMLLFNAKY